MMRQRGKEGGEAGQGAGGPGHATSAGVQVLPAERRGVSAVSKKINAVLYERILPMADQILAAPRATSFEFTEQELLGTVLSNVIRRECPVLVSDRAAMMRAFGEAYDAEVGAVHAPVCQESSQATAFFLEGAALKP